MQAPQLRLAVSSVWAQQLCFTGLAAPWHVESSRTRIEPPHWQADPYSLCPQGSPCVGFFLWAILTPLSSVRFSSVQFSSVAQSCPTLCDIMNRSMPGLPIHHQLPEFTQTHVHRVSDAIQPSHPLSSPSPPAPSPSQHQGLLQ